MDNTHKNITNFDNVKISTLETPKPSFGLHIILGPMFAGKSTYLINKATELLDNSNSSCDDILMINHTFDNRYSNESHIATHDGIKMSSLSLTKLCELLSNDIVSCDDNITYKAKLQKSKHIFIDEGQFFDDLYDIVIILLCKYKKNIYIGGLDGDYKQKQFSNSHLFDLIPFANTIHKLNAKCYICNEPAQCTKRLNTETTNVVQIIVGGSNMYQPVCLNHLDV